MSIQAVHKSSWLKTLIGMALLSLLLTNPFGRENPDLIRWLPTYLVTFTITAAMWLGNGYISEYINRKVSWVEAPGKRITLGVLAMVVYTTFITLLLLEAFEWYYEREFSSSNYWNSLLMTFAVTAIISLILHARSFLINWRQAAIDRERLEKAHVTSQYESLRNQVNPHFLFNSLNVLTELVHQDADEAERFIRQLSRVYRYVLEKREMEVVPLQEEIDFLKSFLFLQEIRQPDTLQVSWPRRLAEGEGVPPLALQLLAENALKHNVLDAARPLQLILRKEGDYLVVENKLQKRQIPTAGTGVGLSNLTNRYKYLTDRPVLVEETEAYFKVSLPLLKLPTL